MESSRLRPIFCLIFVGTFVITNVFPPSVYARGSYADTLRPVDLEESGAKKEVTNALTGFEENLDAAANLIRELNLAGNLDTATPSISAVRSFTRMLQQE